MHARGDLFERASLCMCLGHRPISMYMDGRSSTRGSMLLRAGRKISLCVQKEADLDMTLSCVRMRVRA